MANVIAIANQKGGVGKTMTAVQLGVGLTEQGRNVLLIDADPQGTLTNNLGFRPIEKIPVTLSDLIADAAAGLPIEPGKGILHHAEGVDVIPANMQLSGTERDLVISNDRAVLDKVIEQVKQPYDYVLIDCMPSLGAITLNVLTAANNVIIPVQAQYEASQGLGQLMRTVANTQQHLNPDLKIGGILLTMVDDKTNLAKAISGLIRDAYGAKLRIFPVNIPRTVRLAETGPNAKSIYAYAKETKDPYAEKAATAYMSLTKEVIAYAEKQRTGRNQPDLLR